MICRSCRLPLALCAIAILTPWGSARPDLAETEAAPPASRSIQPTDVAEAIHHLLSSNDGAVNHPDRAALRAIYAPGHLLWTSAGRPTPNARAAQSILAGAASDGLDPGSYGIDDLSRRASALEVGSTTAADVAAFDVVLSMTMLRYMRHLHLGLVDPQTMGFGLNVQAEQHDFVSLLREALANQRIAEMVRELAPPIVQYRLLRDMLARYRGLAAEEFAPLLSPSGSVHPDSSYEGLFGLYQRLVAFGDLPAGSPPSRTDLLYEGPLVEAVKRFQERHGLDPDGILGSATHAALHVAPAVRLRQIELALERLRWLPDLDQRRFIALNIPMFQLWAWDTVPPSGAPTLGMRAIVGRALHTRTPVFVDEMQAVLFRPYWNVPRSILRNELLPLITRDARYLEGHDMELVIGEGPHATVVESSPENLALLRQGRLRVRQRPGPRNALGLVKFDFPNADNVYMHGTPTPQLFSRPRRDFSHGCVRVEDPVMLATWVLQGEPGWTQERVVAAMSAERSTSVKLSQPIQVILFYLTAVVMPEDGTVTVRTGSLRARRKARTGTRGPSEGVALTSGGRGPCRRARNWRSGSSRLRPGQLRSPHRADR